MQKSLDALINAPKDREKTGKAAYHIAGLFMKHGGSHKSWKSRWFVCDDTKVYYYQDKKTWESGPVSGKPKEPQGVVEYNEVMTISTHTTFDCPELEAKKPKEVSNSYCLHFRTSDRTYNLVGFPSIEISQKWVRLLTFAVETYNVKRQAKLWLKENAGLKKDSEEDLTINIKKIQIPPPSKLEKKKSGEDRKKEYLNRPRLLTEKVLNK